jgi:hypothetical protein
MDRLKLETVYLRALDALMSAVDEYQIQAAIFRLRRAQARLHGWEVQGPPTIHSHRRIPAAHGGPWPRGSREERARTRRSWRRGGT